MNADITARASQASPRILLVDDDDFLLEAVTRMLRRAGYTVIAAADAEDALARFAREEPDLVLTDLRLPGASGLDLLQAVRRTHPAMPVLIQTAFEDEPTRTSAREHGVFRVMTKPVYRDELLAIVQAALSAGS